MAYRTLRDRVIIRRASGDPVTAGGIILAHVRKPLEGEVLVVGPGVDLDGVLTPLDVKVGDRVLFPTGAGTEVKVDGELLLVMKESEIIGVFEKD